MKTRTIYSAMQQAEREMRVGLASYAVHVHDPELVKRTRQWATFERELLRRIDQQDASVAPRPSAFASVERIGQYMAGLSDGMKADNIFGAYPPKETPDWRW